MEPGEKRHLHYSTSTNTTSVRRVSLRRASIDGSRGRNTPVENPPRGVERNEVWRRVNITHPTRRMVIAAACALSMGVVSTAGVGVASAYRTATIEFDGLTLPVSGFMATVEDALEAADVNIGEHDEVAPAASEYLARDAKIVVRRAHAYTIDDNGTQREVWSTAPSVEDFMATLNGGVVLAANRSSERGALPFFRSKGLVTVQADGKTHQVEATADDTPVSVLEKAGITVSPIDRVKVRHESQQIVIQVTRVTRGNQVKTEVLPAPIEERDDDTLTRGETKVVAEGKDGSLVTTTYVETVDGQVTTSREMSSVRTEPETRIIANGTKAEVQQHATANSSAGGAAPAPVAGDAWAALAQCESGGNPATNTGNGFYGMYQFSLPTWQSVGGTGLPSDASAAEQTMRAQILQQRAGWGQWPACSARLGLH